MKIKNNELKEIRGVRSNICEENKNKIIWQAAGFDYFIILCASEKKNTDIKNPEVLAALEREEEHILNKEEFYIPELSLNICIFSLSQKNLNGGYIIQGKPGVYAVYGIEINQSDCSIYEEVNNTCIVTISVKCYVKNMLNKKLMGKGFFNRKKPKIYAGYKSVKLDRAVKGIDEDILYHVCGDDFSYPVPSKSVKEGVEFFVSCAEEDRIIFDNNISGVEFKVLDFSTEEGEV